jgi:hypothetical protein
LENLKVKYHSADINTYERIILQLILKVQDCNVGEGRVLDPSGPESGPVADYFEDGNELLFP